MCIQSKIFPNFSAKYIEYNNECLLVHKLYVISSVNDKNGDSNFLVVVVVTEEENVKKSEVKMFFPLESMRT